MVHQVWMYQVERLYAAPGGVGASRYDHQPQPSAAIANRLTVLEQSSQCRSFEACITVSPVALLNAGYCNSAKAWMVTIERIGDVLAYIGRHGERVRGSPSADR
jgi:hypothetical protein